MNFTYTNFDDLVLIHKMDLAMRIYRDLNIKYIQMSKSANIVKCEDSWTPFSRDFDKSKYRNMAKMYLNLHREIKSCYNRLTDTLLVDKIPRVGSLQDEINRVNLSYTRERARKLLL